MALHHYMYTALLLFALGVFGVAFNRKSLLSILMALELMLLGANLTFLVAGVHHQDLKGRLFALMILTVAAAESAVGLALLVVFHKVHRTVALHAVYTLRG